MRFPRSLTTVRAVGLFLFLFALPLSGMRAASFQADGEERLSLNGSWDFTVNPHQPWDTITVPGNWDTLPAYSTYRGKACYRRAFTVPSDWKGRGIRLRFEAVYHTATVYLNGKRLGEHVGGYTPFEFDVTGKLVYGGTNRVSVWADNSYHRGAWWPWGGISRDVNLIANNSVRIVWQHIRSEPDMEAGTATLFVRYKLANRGGALAAVTVASEISGGGVALENSEWQATVPARAEQTFDRQFFLSKEQVKLWHFDHPNLYTLHTAVRDANGEVLHRTRDRFGIRKVEITPDGLFLNGERVRLPGFNRVSDSNETGNTEPDALVRKDVDLMKRCSAAMARLMHMAQAPNLLDYLDEKGMLIIEEIPVWGRGDPQVFPGNPRTKQWLRETVERDYNHPCIIGWSPGNELEEHFSYVESMNKYIREELDPHRIVSYVSYTGARKEYGPANDPITCSGLAFINVYGKPHGRFVSVPKTLRERWPDKPVFFSEFGDRQFGAAHDAKIPGLEAIWAEIAREHPYVIGASLWTFNDYRSDHKGTPASGNREWGVVDIHRRPKAAYGQIRKLYAPVRSLRIAEGKVHVEARSQDEIPSYTLRGYKLQWVKADGSGAGELPLPDLKPGDPVFTASVPNGEIRGTRLIAPTGYDVLECEAP